MVKEYLQQLFELFRNTAMNAVGIKRDLYELLSDGDVGHAMDMFTDNDLEVDQAISEYNPETHDVMKRRNKFRKGEDAYITEKLPRTWQKYINEVELFFLLGNPIKWELVDGDDEAYGLFIEHLKANRFDSKIRQLKRLAGSETEAALMYHLYEENGKIRYDNFILSRYKGYKLRSLFDQYGNLQALAYGYKLKSNGKFIQHWDIHTSEWTFECVKQNIGWDVSVYQNPTSKINGIYANQRKSWCGVSERINRDEMLDSKIADTNNYFSDPIAAATADVIENLKSEEKIAKMMQLSSEKSRFEYINPPQNSESRREEKANLKQSILYDTFTPDFSYDALKGFGTLSGAALKNAMVLGYIKRARNLEIWEDLVDRYKNVALEVMKLEHPDKAVAIDSLKIGFEFTDPFASDRRDEQSSIQSLYSAGLVSLETAVSLLSIAKVPQDEIELIRKETKAKSQQDGNKENVNE